MVGGRINMSDQTELTDARQSSELSRIDDLSDSASKRDVNLLRDSHQVRASRQAAKFWNFGDGWHQFALPFSC
jgi:hypothetical protein